MSKPVAKIVCQQPYKAKHQNGWRVKLPNHLQTFRSEAPDSDSITVDVWMNVYFRFLGLTRVNVVRIHARACTEDRAKHFPYWPNNWLGRLGNFLFGWINT
jgi:hypothetical protein